MVFVPTLLWLACTGPELVDSADVCDGSGDTLTWVMWEILLTRAVDGVSSGFDLDDRVSGTWDDEACNIPDYVRADGTEGIDNALNLAIPALEQTEASAVEPLINSQINEGQILILLELSDLDDPVDDDCVTLRLGQATGKPLVGTDDRLLPGQTFDWDPDAPLVTLPDLLLSGGVVETGPFELDIPFSVFNQEQRLLFHDARVGMTLDPDGTATGTLGGGVDVTLLLEATQQANVDDEVFETLTQLIYVLSDLSPDDQGVCQQISTNLDYQAVSAWTYTD